MSPCFPKPLPAESGGIARRSGQVGNTLFWSLTLWKDGQIYQSTLLTEFPYVPDLFLMLHIFEVKPQSWDVVYRPNPPTNFPA